MKWAVTKLHYSSNFIKPEGRLILDIHPEEIFAA